jgi:hypothetical protein
VLINNAAPQLVLIACNQHGTRALQKMIEFVLKEEQIRTITVALDGKVAELIRDLNGNHVIQKILNHFPSSDIQFIIDQVARECVNIGTHRHGCCVIQRCIDHADRAQQFFLINQITENSFVLVQDPYGNYVVQYILDIGEAAYSEAICRCFLGQVAALSKQKFSSNVIEKVCHPGSSPSPQLLTSVQCIRVADPRVRQLMIEEILAPGELERMLKDSYANYVVQTCLDHADPQQQERLLDCIRPLLPSIRSTPYGRRIANKVEQRLSGPSPRGNTHNGANGNGVNRNGAAPSNGYGGFFPRDGTQALGNAMGNLSMNSNPSTAASTPPQYTPSSSVTPVSQGPAFAMPTTATQFMHGQYGPYGQGQPGLSSPPNGQASYQYTTQSGMITPPPAMSNGVAHPGMMSPPGTQGQTTPTAKTTMSPSFGASTTSSHVANASQGSTPTNSHSRFASLGSLNGTHSALHHRNASTNDNKPSML